MAPRDHHMVCRVRRALAYYWFPRMTSTVLGRDWYPAYALASLGIQLTKTDRLDFSVLEQIRLPEIQGLIGYF